MMSNSTNEIYKSYGLSGKEEDSKVLSPGTKLSNYPIKENADWIKCPRLNPQALIRLFCFPYAGGGASVFYTWHNYLPRHIEICAIQLPGREDRIKEQPFIHFPPLIKVLSKVIEPYLQLPFAFFGHSMGALISFELACELRGQNKPTPAYLFVSGSRAPQLPDPDPPIHGLSDSEFIKKLGSLAGTPEEILQNAELMEIFLPLLRADFTLCENYVYSKKIPFDCPIMVLGGLQDKKVSRKMLESWCIHTKSSFSLKIFKGNHFFLQSSMEPILKTISTELLRLENRK